MPVFAVEPIGLVIVAAIVALLGLVGLSVLWWAIKSTVRMAMKLIVFCTFAVIASIAVATGVIVLLSAG